MGKLRNFVKQHRVDETARIRHHKHPKTLKIIQQFNIDASMQEYIANEKVIAEEMFEKMKEESVQLVEESSILNQKFEPQFLNVENAFFDNFQFLMDDPSDPFLFQQNDFNKKMFESESEDIFFV